MGSHIRSFSLIASMSVLALGVVACSGKKDAMTGMQMQMQHMDNARANYGSHLNDMADNAILHDMTVADIHFVPHSSELSGTGVYRLDRMIPLLNTYGGTVRYESDLRDEELLNKRLDHVREYLAVGGCNLDRVDVKPMISGGRPSAADKAILVDLKGTAKPASSGAGGAAGGAAAGMSGSSQN